MATKPTTKKKVGRPRKVKVEEVNNSNNVVEEVEVEVIDSVPESNEAFIIEGVEEAPKRKWGEFTKEERSANGKKGYQKMLEVKEKRKYYKPFSQIFKDHLCTERKNVIVEKYIGVLQDDKVPIQYRIKLLELILRMMGEINNNPQVALEDSDSDKTIKLLIN